MTCRHLNADHLMPGDLFSPDIPHCPPWRVDVEQLRCVDCAAWLALGKARLDGEHAEAVAVEMRAAELAAAWKPVGGIQRIATADERDGWMLWPHESPYGAEHEAGWLASQIQNHRMDGQNIAGAEHAAQLAAAIAAHKEPT